MKATTESRNLSEQAYDGIRRDILSGSLIPGKRLQIEAIWRLYSIGAMPIREALNRLSAEGLVEHRSHRGFCVAPISLSDLSELVKTRIWLETLALRESIANIDEGLEEALVVGFHRPARAQRQIPRESGNEISQRNGNSSTKRSI